MVKIFLNLLYTLILVALLAPFLAPFAAGIFDIPLHTSQVQSTGDSEIFEADEDDLAKSILAVDLFCLLPLLLLQAFRLKFDLKYTNLCAFLVFWSMGLLLLLTSWGELSREMRADKYPSIWPWGFFALVPLFGLIYWEKYWRGRPFLKKSHGVSEQEILY